MASVRWLRVAVVGVLALGLATVALADPPGTVDKKPTEAAKGPAGGVEMKFTDNSTLKLTLLDEKIEFVTPYGKLTVPVGDVQQVEFATRIPEDAVKKVEKAIADLGSPEFKKREDATAELLRLPPSAVYPALLEAAKSSDAEVKRRAEAALEKVKQSIPEDMLKVRKDDVLTTEHGKFTGRLETGTLRVKTVQFGEQQVKLSDVRSLRSLAVKAQSTAAAVNVQPDPGAPGNLSTQIGQVFYFRVTGANNGALWGTDVYTSDSTIAMAAVHAGVLKVGETGVVKVTIVVPPPAFDGTTRNGITSSPYGAWPGAYTVGPVDTEK